MSEKINLLNLNQQELEEFVVSLGMKKFYGKQLFNWLHKKIVRDLNEVTNLSLKDRELLTEKAYIPFLNLLKHQVSKIDKTEKFLFHGNEHQNSGRTSGNRICVWCRPDQRADLHCVR